MDLAAPSFVKSEAARPPKQARMEDADESGEEEVRSKGVRAKSPKVARELPEHLKRKGQASGSGGGGRRAGPQAEGGYEAELALATAALALETKAESRETKGYLETSALIPASAKIVMASLEEGVAFNKEREEKPKQNIGSAHGRIAVAGLLGLSKMPEVKGTDLEQNLQAFWDQVVVSKGIKEVEKQVHVFRMRKPKIPSSRAMSFGQEPYARLTYRLAPATQQTQVAANLEQSMTTFFISQGWEVLTGTAPKSHNEREVIDLSNNVRRARK